MHEKNKCHKCQFNGLLTDFSMTAKDGVRCPRCGSIENDHNERHRIALIAAKIR